MRVARREVETVCRHKSDVASTFTNGEHVPRITANPRRSDSKLRVRQVFGERNNGFRRSRRVHSGLGTRRHDNQTSLGRKQVNRLRLSEEQGVVGERLKKPGPQAGEPPTTSTEKAEWKFFYARLGCAHASDFVEWGGRWVCVVGQAA